MNRTEQKDRMKDILSDLDDAIKNSTAKKEEFDSVIENFDKLEDQIYGVIEDNDIELSSVKEEFTNAFFSNLLETVYDSLYEFQEDISYAISELSEKRAEALEERYADLEYTLERLSQEQNEYENIDDLISNLNEAKEELTDMYK